jgi:hypothetical protein
LPQGASTPVTGGEATTPAAGGVTTPGTTRTATSTTTPATTPATSAPTTQAAATKTRPAEAPLSEKNLMVAASYLAAGWPTAQLRTGKGAGQAAITACQTKNPEEQYGLTAMFSAQAESGDLYADQWVLDFRHVADAQQMLSDVVDWRTLCTDPSNQAMKGFTFTASKAVQVTLPDDSEGQRWSMDFEQDNHVLRQLVAVVRTGTRVSVSVVSTSPAAAKVVDAEELAERSAGRLGGAA